MGGGIRGGRAIGKWPGLSAGLLTGYRNVLAPILTRHGRAQRLRTIFPAFALEPLDVYGRA